jgi:hypothetical protein
MVTRGSLGAGGLSTGTDGAAPAQRTAARPPMAKCAHLTAIVLVPLKHSARPQYTTLPIW